MRILNWACVAAFVLTATAEAGTPVKPDSSHATYILPKNLKWKVESLGQLQAPLFGDPTKPGPYGVLIKWLPGHMSRPHFHSTDRWAYVVSGTWWVSTSNHYDPSTTWPLPPRQLCHRPGRQGSLGRRQG